MDLPPYLAAGTPFSASEVAEIEQTVGMPLPESYKAFVAVHGNAYVTEDFDDWRYVHVDWRRTDGRPVPPEDAEEIETVFPFYGLWPADTALDQYTTLHIADDRLLTIPRHYFPIGHDTGGAKFWLDLSEEGKGSVWVIYTNINVPWGEEGNNYIGFVAHDFEDFIAAKLQDPPEDW